jgi:hypothetical protein
MGRNFRASKRLVPEPERGWGWRVSGLHLYARGAVNESGK